MKTAPQPPPLIAVRATGLPVPKAGAPRVVVDGRDRNAIHHDEIVMVPQDLYYLRAIADGVLELAPTGGSELDTARRPRPTRNKE